MIAKRFTFKRYQLKKEAVRALEQNHPWIFRRWISTAANVFSDGQWLVLYDGHNQIRGYGIYEATGAIAIRVLRYGSEPPNLSYFASQVKLALEKRHELKQTTGAYRAINGESDAFPGIVIDVYGAVAVLQTYCAGADALGRWVMGLVAQQLKLSGCLWKSPQKRLDKSAGQRRLRGTVPDSVGFDEGDMHLCADLSGGQKSGVFLDLRGLRRLVRGLALRGKRVLNLFCYTGTIGLAAEMAGAESIVQVDCSERALEFARRCHTVQSHRHQFIEADIFSWIKELPEEEMYDLIIVDTPALTSQSSQLPQVMKSLANLYQVVAKHVAPSGYLIACDCTSRITREAFQEMLDKQLAASKELGRRRRFRKRRSLPPEIDHQPGFTQADYLKVEVFAKL